MLTGAEQAHRDTLRLARETLDLIGGERTIADDGIRVAGDQLGGGYGVPTPEMIDAVRLMARTEALLFDPVYSGKALAGLPADLRAGTFAR